MNVDTNMNNVVDRFTSELQKIRTGRANPALVTELPVDSYGTTVPLKQVAQVATPDAASLLISPWDPGVLPAIQQALKTSDVGIEPITDGNTLRLPIPPMTEERRRDLTRAVSEKLEAARINVRNLRHEAISEADKEDLPLDMMKRRKEDLTKKAQEFDKRLEELAEAKKQELMTV